ncbi:MAG: hypothetical protein BWY95_01208 [Bacteroidetes bacterium ADurb.BinA104]|nr:MAG: hypothetical protein BWY95_01208 [Bacteroidetes bacterium ADurb.BinA104]
MPVCRGKYSQAIEGFIHPGFPRSQHLRIPIQGYRTVALIVLIERGSKFHGAVRLIIPFGGAYTSPMSDGHPVRGFVFPAAYQSVGHHRRAYIRIRRLPEGGYFLSFKAYFMLNRLVNSGYYYRRTVICPQLCVEQQP